MNPLEARLRYKFRNPLLLAEALTHASLGHETHRHHFDNQRLEFLGDAVLQLVFTEYLFDRFPGGTEGALTKARARLVSREGLRVLAEDLDLGRFMMMGRGEESSGGRQRAGVLADAFEALLGAIYLDSDYVTARRVVLHAARSHLTDLNVHGPEGNPKGELQEILQSLSPVSPSYVITDQTGPEHDKRFVANVLWLGLTLGSGDGRSKKEAEVAAASEAMRQRRWLDRQNPSAAFTGDPVNVSAQSAESESSSP